MLPVKLIRRSALVNKTAVIPMTAPTAVSLMARLGVLTSMVATAVAMVRATAIANAIAAIFTGWPTGQKTRTCVTFDTSIGAWAGVTGARCALCGVRTRSGDRIASRFAIMRELKPERSRIPAAASTRAM